MNKYRVLNYDDLKTISLKRHNFFNCKGQIFCLWNTKQAVIITNKETTSHLESHLNNRKAYITARLSQNDKMYLLIQAENLASIKKCCNRYEIKAPRKIKLLLGLNDILLKSA